MERDSMRTVISIFLLLAAPALTRAAEWWAWSSLELWRQDQNSASLFMGNRLDADDGAYVQIISPRFKRAVLPWLDAGLGLSLLSIENTITGDRFSQFRPELELNPRFTLNDHLQLEWRNRLECRQNEGQSFTLHRSRHRLQLGLTLPHPIGPLTRVFISNEWLSNLDRMQQGENRLVPLGVTFKLTDRSQLDLFYMVFSTRTDAQWQHESVIGTYWRVKF
jgi:hypothetical protein